MKWMNRWMDGGAPDVSWCCCQALLPPLTLQKKGLVPAAPALRACATSTSSSSARQTFPSGLWPTVKDCFGLHGHSAFGSVAKEESGVGQPPVVEHFGSTILASPTWSIRSRRARLLTSSAALRSPQTCFRLPHCLGRFAPCGYAHPPGDAGCGDFVTFAMAALPAAGRLPAAAGHRAAVVDCDVIAGGGDIFC